MNECAQLLAMSTQLNSTPPFGSIVDGECCLGTIVCDLNRKIVEIDLSDHKLNGVLPDSLFSLANLTEINLSDNPTLIGSLPRLSSRLRYIDVSNTGLSGPVDISMSSLTTCKFGTLSKLCLQSKTLSGIVCAGVRDLDLCSVKSTSSFTPGTTSISTSTVIQSQPRLSTTVAQASNSGVPSSEIHLDNSDITSPIIILWTIAAIVMAVSLMLCLCLMFAHKYGSSAQISKPGSKSKIGEGRRCSSSYYNVGKFNSRIESLVENRPIYEARAEKNADKIISLNGERYFPVTSEYSRDKSDEISLSSGDTVTLYRVFDDGWAEGVSLRNGRSAYFPLKCLGGSVPLILQDPEFFQSNIISESDIESIVSPLPPLLHVTPVFMSPTSAKHTCLPVLDVKKSSYEKSEKLIDLDYLEGRERSDSEPLISDQNLDFDSSYNPFRGSILNKKSSTDVSFPDMIHSAETSSSFFKNS